MRSFPPHLADLRGAELTLDLEHGRMVDRRFWLSQDAATERQRALPLPIKIAERAMPGYRIEFTNADDSGVTREVHCVDDAQVLRWAFGLLGSHAIAEVWHGDRNVGRVTPGEDAPD